jgi:hypothetical protein
MPEHSTTKRRRVTVVILIVLQLAAILAYDHLDRVERRYLEHRMELHGRLVEGDAPYQYRYRILVPTVAEVLARGLQALPLIRESEPSPGRPYGTHAFQVAYLVLDAAAITMFLFGLQLLLESFFPVGLSLLGTAMAAVITGFTFRDHYFHPWSLWEAAFFALGLLSLRRGRFGWFTLINVLGLLNRETSAFLCLAFAFLVRPGWPVAWAAYLRRRDVRFALANGVIWLVGFFALHRVVGYQPSTLTVARAVSRNVEEWSYSLLLNLLVFGPAWLLVLKGIRRAPEFIRRTAWILPFYLGLLLVIGFWWEIRYWMTALPILIPALLAGAQPGLEAALAAAQE